MYTFILLAFLSFAIGERVKGTYENIDFQGFKLKFDKSYSRQEEIVRYQAYVNNVEFINQHNTEYDMGKWTFWCGLNELSDMTPEEYKQWNNLRTAPLHDDAKFRKVEDLSVPDSIDWREKNAVQVVKSQGGCGSCWAFSTCAALEGQWAIHNGELPNCAEQQLVSCDTHSYACQGGWVNLAYDYIRDNGVNGIDTTESYPYVGLNDVCHFDATQDKQNIAATITGYLNVEHTEEALKEAVANVGPISIAIATNPPSFMNYEGGIYDDAKCSDRLDHAVTVVGYNVTDGFWIVKNSWGSRWGESGYIRMVMGKNMCALANDPKYPVV